MTDWTVGQLNTKVRDTLQERFPQPIWLTGEVQGYDRNQAGRHAYFEVVERRSKDDAPVAKIRAVAFGADRSRIVDALAKSNIALADGLKVRLSVRVDLYTAGGAFQVQVKDVDPAFSVADRIQRRDEIVARLESESLLERNHAVRWAVCPLRVALITSAGSDAAADFDDELSRSPYAFDVRIFDAQMQGVDTETTILSALRHVYRARDQFDVVAIVRGGGSRTDLSYFDSYALGHAVCHMPVKVVCGVGHHMDRCVLDFVAHSEKTPTAAAQGLVARVSSFEQRLVSYAPRLQRALEQGVERANSRVRDAAVRLDRRVQELVHRNHRLVDDRQHRLRSVAQARLNRESQALDIAQTQLTMSDPRRILERGFAIVHGDHGVVSSVEAASTNSQVSVEFADGRVSMTVEKG